MVRAIFISGGRHIDIAIRTNRWKDKNRLRKQLQVVCASGTHPWFQTQTFLYHTHVGGTRSDTLVAQFPWKYRFLNFSNFCRCFFIVPGEPVQPIDPSAWVAHTNAMKVAAYHGQAGAVSPSMTSMTSGSSSLTSSIPESESKFIFQRKTLGR